MQKKILHLTTHLGGGVGSVVLNYLEGTANDENFSHRVICLGYADEHAVSTLKKAGVPLMDRMSSDHKEILTQIADSDIVLIHWWNHPLLSDFLMREQLPPSRVIFWSHIVGSTAPNNFTEKLLTYPDLFVFTNPLSYEVKEVKELDAEHKKRLRDIWSTGTVNHVTSLKFKKHDGFNIGYIGTVDFAKMHPDFLEISDRVNIPDVRFIIIGPPNGKQMSEEAKRLGIGDKFNFTGFISEAEKWEYLSTFDVFGYPLVPGHYGTCDLALQEAMATGVVPVVFANPMERCMVQDRVTGIVARDKDEYVRALEELHRNPDLRHKLSKNAREYAINTFSLKKMTSDWDETFHKILNLPKTLRKWDMEKKPEDITPKDIFLESLGHHGGPFTSYCTATNDEERATALVKIRELAKLPAWQSETKSSVHNFNSFLPNDPFLSFWSHYMKTVSTSEAGGGTTETPPFPHTKSL